MYYALIIITRIFKLSFISNLYVLAILCVLKIWRNCRSHWPHGLRSGSVTARLLRLRVRIPPGGMDVCLLCVLCVVRYSSLRRADHSSRGVLPTVVRRCVWFRNLVNEETLAHWGLLRQKRTKHTLACWLLHICRVETCRSLRISCIVYHTLHLLDNILITLHSYYRAASEQVSS
jgi:hypothetical protein